MRAEYRPVLVGKLGVSYAHSSGILGGISISPPVLTSMWEETMQSKLLGQAIVFWAPIPQYVPAGRHCRGAVPQQWRGRTGEVRAERWSVWRDMRPFLFSRMDALGFSGT